MADDLAQLFEPLNRRGATESQLSAVLNITDFALWNIVTSVTENIDTGTTPDKSVILRPQFPPDYGSIYDRLIGRSR